MKITPDQISNITCMLVLALLVAFAAISIPGAAKEKKRRGPWDKK